MVGLITFCCKTWVWQDGEETQPRGRQRREKPGKMLQKQLPRQLQEEPLRRRGPQVQKGLVAASLHAAPRTSEGSALLPGGSSSALRRMAA